MNKKLIKFWIPGELLSEFDETDWDDYSMLQKKFSLNIHYTARFNLDATYDTFIL